MPAAWPHLRRCDPFLEVERALDGRPVRFNTSVGRTPGKGLGAHDTHLTITDTLENVTPEPRHISAGPDAENEEVRRFRVTGLKDNKQVDNKYPGAGRSSDARYRYHRYPTGALGGFGHWQARS